MSKVESNLHIFYDKYFLRHTECFSISIAASFVDDICKLGDFS